MNNTTLKKISEILGLSISTISRALKDHPDISAKTKQRVVELATTLDYEPNANAINLRTSNSKLFGLIVPSISNWFYNAFIASVEEDSRRNGYSLMILQSGDDPSIEINNLKLCRQNRITGLFVCISPETTNIEPFLKLKEMDIPVIFFDKVPDDARCNKVCVADALSATMAANELISKKKKKIAGLFGNPHLLITQKRLEAFRKTIHEKSGAAQLIIDYAPSTEDAESKTIELLKEKPDAIFCMSDEILIGVMKAIQRKGLSIPKDLGVITISNGAAPKLYFPEITYVETSGHKLGKMAYSSMMACLGGSTFIQDLTIESILVEGGSL
ncbi:MAG: LacI family DNA-binding transcriptional regulator [Bacteroidetes bacterium]|nr:LacI family DNA-binding transcriptional regulator [Bacteroidota bacterium]